MLQWQVSVYCYKHINWFIIHPFKQDLQQVMVSGPNLNETSIVSGGYGGPAGGIIPTSSIKGIDKNPKSLL